MVKLSSAQDHGQGSRALLSEEVSIGEQQF